MRTAGGELLVCWAGDAGDAVQERMLDRKKRKIGSEEATRPLTVMLSAHAQPRGQRWRGGWGRKVVVVERREEGEEGRGGSGEAPERREGW